MAWTIACFCGYVFRCSPPGLCPACGELVDAHDLAWLERARDEVGYTTDDDARDTGAAW
jgi:hypothetical protein